MQVLMWRGTDPETQGFEYFTLQQNPDPVLEGTIVTFLEGQPTRIIYRLECTPDWKTRQVFVQQDRGDERQSRTLYADGNGTWRDDNGVLSIGQGLVDIDLAVSPATNTLHLRRTGLAVGETREVEVLWMQFPDLSLDRLPQTYKRTDATHIDYEAPTQAYADILEVDADMLVIKYGSLWQRL
jgi:uncharacterized protein